MRFHIGGASETDPASRLAWPFIRPSRSPESALQSEIQRLAMLDQLAGLRLGTRSAGGRRVGDLQLDLCGRSGLRFIEGLYTRVDENQESTPLRSPRRNGHSRPERAGMESEGRRARTRDLWRRRAERASEAYGLVLLLVLVTYVLASLIKSREWGPVVLAIATSATSIVALTSSRVRETAVRRALVVAGLAILLSLVSAAVGGRAWLAIASLLEICLLAVAMGTVLRRVTASETVTSRTLLGAVSVYASLGILFSWVYGAIDRIEGGGFFGQAQESATDFLFFSYTTLTTTGYGNLVPAGQAGRMVAGLEMMTGQVFLVTLVAGLVSLWRPGEGLLRRRGKDSYD